jgi:glycerol uptake facilitator-like aquaporin
MMPTSDLVEAAPRRLPTRMPPSIPANSTSLTRRVVAEALGTALLLAAVVGSGIMGERLAVGSVGLALLANSLATGAALVALILTFGPISGAHFNPVVTLASAWRRELRWQETPWFLAAQISGAFAGVMLANAMFGEPTVSLSNHVRAGAGQWLSEAVATFGLLAVIASCSRAVPSHVAYGVAAYITAAYWFTASTSFANPAVTLARSITHTFAGIRPVDVPPFVAAQVLGATLAVALFSWLVPRTSSHAVSSGPSASDRF